MDEKNLHNKRTDQDLIDDLRKMTDDIPVPPALEPDAVERMLEGRAKKKRRKYVRIYGGAAAAAVTEHIKNIRAKLRPAGESPIETVWGVGYKWKNG